MKHSHISDEIAEINLIQSKNKCTYYVNVIIVQKYGACFNNLKVHVSATSSVGMNIRTLKNLTSVLFRRRPKFCLLKYRRQPRAEFYPITLRHSNSRQPKKAPTKILERRIWELKPYNKLIGYLYFFVLIYYMCMYIKHLTLHSNILTA